ncbi:hypothetical protein LUZ60_009264 [Juncus effusus]|nr:hypothetical protein LUZ60_009264 [Juncus effusus]
MANPTKRSIHYIQKLCSYQNLSNPINPSSYISQINQICHYSTSIARPTSQNCVFSRLLSQNFTSLSQSGFLRSGFSNSRQFSSQLPRKLEYFGSGIKGLGQFSQKRAIPIRFFSIRSSNSSNLGKTVLDKPLNVLKSAVSRYRYAVGLQMEAFWKRNYMVIAGIGAVISCIFLWRILFSIADMTVGISEGLAKYGFLALATAMVAFSGMYVKSRFSINPDRVYRTAMRKLNTSPAVLEVMGAPLTGTDLRAYVVSGGGPKLKDFKLKFGGKRCFLIFPIRGSERRGLVSVEVKKKKGQYDMKLLAVDIPMVSGSDQRLFLIGDEKEYKIGGGLISELRDPIVMAMAAEKEFDVLDEIEEREDERREKEEAERKQREQEERAVEEETRRREEREREKIVEEEEKKAGF